MADPVGSGFLPGFTDGGDDPERGPALKPGGPFCPSGTKPEPPEHRDPDHEEQDDDTPCPFIPVDIMRPDPEDGAA